MYFHHYNIVTPLGLDLATTAHLVLREQSGIARYPIYGQLTNVCLSKIGDGALESKYQQLVGLEGFSRLEKMLLLAVAPILRYIKITPRTALILSTTKGNISALAQGNPTPLLSATAQKIANAIGISTTPIVVSNACVSGAMALSVADSLLKTDSYDSAVVLAGDEISEFVLSGFQSFQAMSARPCKPYDATRDGITLGEATAAVYVSKEAQGAKAQLLGSSSINDANHISGPSRTGEGLYLSVQNALDEAKIDPKQIDLINAHGTGTLYNDEMESIAFMRANLLSAPLNSYKAYFGHTLGTSGLLETLLTIELAHYKTLLKSLNFETLGVSHPINVLRETQHKEVN
ncbi:beta-ketoacyl synthase N-terminal-like domain-containing protein [Capnocytophaga sp.]